MAGGRSAEETLMDRVALLGVFLLLLDYFACSHFLSWTLVMDFYSCVRTLVMWTSIEISFKTSEDYCFS